MKLLLIKKIRNLYNHKIYTYIKYSDILTTSLLVLVFLINTVLDSRLNSSFCVNVDKPFNVLTLICDACTKQMKWLLGSFLCMCKPSTKLFHSMWYTLYLGLNIMGFFCFRKPMYTIWILRSSSLIEVVGLKVQL